MALKDGIQRLLTTFAQAFDAMPGSHDADDEVQALMERTCSHLQAAEGTAGNESDEIFFKAKRAIRVLAVEILPNDTLTANDTDYKTISLKKADGAAGSETTVASVTTKITGGSNDWADKTAVALTLSATDANRNLAAGEYLLLDIAATASGVATPQFTLHVDYKLI